jgi:hypothetical protein
MVTMSKDAAPVAASVVTRERRVPSSSTSQLRRMSGFAASKRAESSCMTTMSGLFTVAMVTVVWAAATPRTSAAAAAISQDQRVRGVACMDPPCVGRPRSLHSRRTLGLAC